MLHFQARTFTAPHCDEGDESILYLTLSDKRKNDDENNVLLVHTGTDLEET